MLTVLWLRGVVKSPDNFRTFLKRICDTCRSAAVVRQFIKKKGLEILIKCNFQQILVHTNIIYPLQLGFFMTVTYQGQSLVLVTLPWNGGVTFIVVTMYTYNLLIKLHHQTGSL